ncbi:MAG: M28 family peptidase [Acidobacteriaceae bacterium]|nr:M28 family peptidase [Acidobacteriaceae bacterium]MBV9779535.1 M28 family peptidase [Acidobacteriaceae bacterium]
MPNIKKARDTILKSIGTSLVRFTPRTAVTAVSIGFGLLGFLAIAGSYHEQAASAKIPLGFTPSSFSSESRWEEQLMSTVSPQRCRTYLRKLTSEPHVAGTAGDRRVSEYIASEFRKDGLETELVEYKVLLSYPEYVSLEMVAPDRRRLANPEPPISGDRDTEVSDPIAHIPWNAYSPSADLTRPVIYVNYGRPEDYDRLEKLNVTVRNRIVLARYFHGYRGGKSLEAEKRGVAAVIVYSDPEEDGAAKGKVYPDGPWGPLFHFQRGATVYDFIAPGNAEPRILPKIPMIPLSAADAKEILGAMRGREAPGEWQGGLRSSIGPYHMGDGNTQVHFSVGLENRVTPIWDVIGRIRGTEEPERLLVLSNHHDAWVYGAVDPGSGTATMLELARAFGEMLRSGFRPRRTILFGSWDAEEFTLTGSTEWGQQHESELRQNGVVCLNVDSATSGDKFTVSTVPSMLRAIIEAAQAVREADTKHSVYEGWKQQRKAAGNIRSYRVEGASSAGVPFGVLGGGSDFMVFLQHDGVPSLDMIFDGPYGVYHSLYDDFEWMSRFGDPTFVYHATMANLWGVLALRFANADTVPLDYSLYGREIESYLKEIEKTAPAAMRRELASLVEKCHAWQQAATELTDMEKSPAEALNRTLMDEERALLSEHGIPGRPWFRHLIYAPLPSYEAETLPGLREALVAHDLDRAVAQARELGAAFDRATELCHKAETTRAYY